MDGSFGIFFAIMLLLGIAGFVVWVWALVDIVKVPDDSSFRAGNKLIWVLVIVFTGVVGAIVYLIVGRPSSAGPATGRALPPQVPPPPPGSIG
jgi:Phospholipase_D-nuclease N-terminal